MSFRAYQCLSSRAADSSRQHVNQVGRSVNLAALRFLLSGNVRQSLKSHPTLKLSAFDTESTNEYDFMSLGPSLMDVACHIGSRYHRIQQHPAPDLGNLLQHIAGDNNPFWPSGRQDQLSFEVRSIPVRVITDMSSQPTIDQRTIE